MLLNLSKSSFFRSGDIIKEEDGEHQQSHKYLNVARRRKSLSVGTLHNNTSGSNDLLPMRSFQISPQ